MIFNTKWLVFIRSYIFKLFSEENSFIYPLQKTFTFFYIASQKFAATCFPYAVSTA